MTKRTQKFIEKATSVHGDKYDYSLVEYKNNKTKVKIICKMHGIFEQIPYNHLRGYGCPKCGIEKRKTNLEEFINKARLVHGNKYDYSLVEYKNNKTKVKIICPEHGVFRQTPYHHLSRQGCPKCAGNKKLNNEEFINKARLVHGNKYDYSLVEYKNILSKVKIICPEHGEFEQKPNDHLNGKGCPKCSITISKPEQEIADFIYSLGQRITTKRRHCLLIITTLNLSISGKRNG